MDSQQVMSVPKWIGLTLSVAFTAYIAFMLLVMNPMVLTEIKTKPTSEMAGEALVLKFASGKEIPVNYLKEGNKVFVGADGPWWREFKDGPTPVSIIIKSESFNGLAVVVQDDPEYTEEVFLRLRPTAPEWLPDWLQGKLVVIELAP